jgi:hypothetical protein
LVLLSLKSKRELSSKMPKAKYNNKFNSIQKKIIRFINETPGIRYRELLRITGVSNGAL